MAACRTRWPLGIGIRVRGLTCARRNATHGFRASVDQRRAIAVLAGKYLSLTTFRRDGTGVATPVWFVQEGRRLLVETDRYSYKVSRIRGNPDVQIAECTATGRLRGKQMNARAELLPDAETGRVERLLADKYRLDLVFIRPIRALQAMLHRGERRRTRSSSRSLRIEPLMPATIAMAMVAISATAL